MQHDVCPEERQISQRDEREFNSPGNQTPRIPLLSLKLSVWPSPDKVSAQHFSAETWDLPFGLKITKRS